MKRIILLLTMLVVVVSGWASVISGGINYELKSDHTATVIGNNYSGQVSIPQTLYINGVFYHVTRIGEYAFNNCPYLTSVSIPTTVTSIGKCAFRECRGLTSMTIPSSVTEIGAQAFVGCSGLISFQVSKNSKHFCSEDNVLFNNDKSELLFCVMTKKGNYSIPSTVRSIDSYAFYDCNNLASVTIPNSVTSIGIHAFTFCNSLTTITIPNSVTSIGTHAFVNCSSLKSITIGNGVTSIGEYTFSGCSSVTSITMGNNLTSIGEDAFSWCVSLTSVIFPNSVTSIADLAFYGCNSLTSVTLGNSVKSIGAAAFKENKMLASVYIYANTPPSLGPNAFMNSSEDITLYVPEKSYDKYKSSSWAPYFSQIIPMQETISVSNLTINPTSASLKVDETLQLEAIITPSNATNKEVTWSSSNTSVATVSSTGQVTAKAVGTATITCMANDGSEKSATCEIIVEKKEVKITSITLNSTAETLAVGATKQLTVTIRPSNAPNKTVTWSTSNASVATVSDRGLVTAKAIGTTTITCMANDGSGKSATCKITVEKEVKITSITLNSTADTLAVGATKQLTATISPSNATNKNVTWSTNNTSVATVSSNGLVTAKSVGTATITCMANDGSGKSATCKITVEQSSTEGDDTWTSTASENWGEIATDPIYLGTAYDVASPIRDEYLYLVQDCKWSTKGNPCIHITSKSKYSCIIETRQVGECKLYFFVTFTDGDTVEGYYSLKVVENNVIVNSITLNATSKTMKTDDTFQLTATISPSNATNKEVTWSSSNASVATVSSDGLVTAKAAGTATITCKANDGSEKSATCKITVENKEIKVSSITLNSTAETLVEGATYQLSATISPSNATNKEVTWSSSNASVATVSSDGLVTAKAAGTATITCKANDGSEKSATCTISVNKKYDIIRIWFIPNGYNTFYSSESAYLLPEGVSAQVVTACTNNKLTYKTIATGSAGGIIPKGTAVMLVSDVEEQGIRDLTPCESMQTYTGTNYLHGSDEATTTTASGTNYYYKLTYGEGAESEIFGWYWGAEDGAAFLIDGHKAWLALPKSSVTRSGFALDDETAIEEVITEEDAVYYDLQGRRIGTPTASGIYIVNGKKVMIKK